MPTVPEALDAQAIACERLGSPLYGRLLASAADDARAGGPIAALLAGHADAPWHDALALRLLGGVHALALAGRAPELAACYPSAGGVLGDPEAAWQAFRQAVIDHADQIRPWLARPPQTNEVGRAVPLLAGLLLACDDGAELPVRLVELGSSAGLNLRADRFRWRSGEVAWGPADSPVQLDGAWRPGPPERVAAAARRTPHLEIRERTGCDPDPLDPRDPAAALRLRAYVWPEQAHRRARLDGALAIAGAVPATVHRLGAADLLERLTLVEGCRTVVWHSIMRQYVPAREWARVEEQLDRLARESGPGRPFAHVAFEPAAGAQVPFVLTVRIGDAAPETVAHAHPHGIPSEPVSERL